MQAVQLMQCIYAYRYDILNVVSYYLDYIISISSYVAACTPYAFSILLAR